MIGYIHHGADLSVLFVVIAILVALVGLYFLWVREFIGAIVAIVIAILIVWLLT